MEAFRRRLVHIIYGSPHRMYEALHDSTTRGSPWDIWKWNTWRTPGTAPVSLTASEPCGMAGGSRTEKHNGIIGRGR